MEERRGIEVRLEIVRCLDREADVRYVQRRRRPVDRQVREAQRREHHDRDADRDEDDEGRGGQQAAGPACVERRQVHGPRLLQLSDDQPRDQEARDDEEHVDPDEPAPEHGSWAW